MKDLQHSIKRIGKRVLIGAILLISVNILIYSLVVHYYLKAGVSQPPAQFIRKLADRLHIENNNFKVDSLLLVQVKEQQMWVMLLDDKQRNIRWAVNLPGLLPDTTTLGDISTLAKSHLKNDSPAGCKRDEEMFAASDLNDNSPNFDNMQQITEMKFFPVLNLLLILGNISVLILGYLFIDRRMLHSLKSILGGIQRLSRGETVRVNEKGVFSDVASCLNQTSDLLHKQTAYRENWIAGVSHDVRTPLSVILGRAGQLEDGDYSSEETRKQALYIKNQALKLRELINDLNLFSQLEKGTQPLREETFPPSVFFRQTIAAFLNNDPRTQYYQIETRIDPNIEKSTLHGDPGLLSRTINNLLYNSIQHTPAGTTLTLSLTYQSGFYRFSVSDNGKGVSPTFLQKLQTLAQGEIPDLLPGQEHGLGLSIVCQIVKLHKGKICFHNLQPHGFSTEILLPE